MRGSEHSSQATRPVWRTWAPPRPATDAAATNTVAPKAPAHTLFICGFAACFEERGLVFRGADETITIGVDLMKDSSVMFGFPAFASSGSACRRHPCRPRPIRPAMRLRQNLRAVPSGRRRQRPMANRLAMASLKAVPPKSSEYTAITWVNSRKSQRPRQSRRPLPADPCYCSANRERELVSTTKAAKFNSLDPSHPPTPPAAASVPVRGGDRAR